MQKTVIYSICVISVIQLGSVFMSSSNVWLGVLGIGISILGIILTGIFLYTQTPRLIKEIKLRWNTR